MQKPPENRWFLHVKEQRGFLLPGRAKRDAQERFFLDMAAARVTIYREVISMQRSSLRIKLAEALSEYAHFGQKDKAGAEYVLHPKAVAAKLDEEDDVIAALLHDTLEDTSVTEATIRNLFGDVVADAVVSVTRKEGEDYFDFIRRANRNPIGRRVKIADLEHNMDASRLPTITDHDRKRLEKYSRALSILTEERSP